MHGDERSCAEGQAGASGNATETAGLDELRAHGAPRGETVAYMRRMRASAAGIAARPGLVWSESL